MAGVEHQILERMRLVHEQMVYTHGLEIYHVVLSVLYLELDFIQLRLQVHLPLDKPFLHCTGDAASLLTQDIQVFLYTVQLILKDFLLYLVRLRYHAELVVREDNAVPVVVLDVVENPLPLVGREVVLPRIEQLGVRVSRLESLCYLLHVGFESEYHRLVRQAEPLHLISCGTHDKRLSCPHLMVADPSSIEFEHPHGIFLTIVQAFDAQAFQIKVRECLMGTIILGTHKTIESVIVEFLQPLLELIALLVQPIGKAVSDLIDFSVCHLYGFRVPYLDLLVADHDFLGNVGRRIQQGVLHQGNPVVSTMLSPHTEPVPDIGIVHPCLHGILVRT